jgi:SAM-dependent methyltransferase
MTAEPASSVRAHAVLALHGAVVFVGASLLFVVQPMVGKALLPHLGGVPGAWTACLLFFQAALLGGYAYVWAGARWLPLGGRVALHLGLLAVAAFGAPAFGATAGPGFSATEHPEAYALAFLGLNLGLPFWVLSATSPLVQDWFARGDHPAAARPYFLYAASNLGSLGALLAYPSIVEPSVALSTQQALFRSGYALLALGVALTGALALRARDPRPTEAAPGAPSVARRLRWVGLAFAPTLLLASASTYVSLDVAPMPLLWVAPLGLYLVSFVLAFSERVPSPGALAGRALALLGVVLVFVVTSRGNEPLWLLLALHLAFLFLGSWIAHARLADDAPHPAHLPAFYTYVALGGALGTIVSAVLAPALLPDLWEYPAAIALVTALRAKVGVVRDDRSLRGDAVAVLVVLGLLSGGGALLAATGSVESIWAPLILAPALLVAYSQMPWRRRFALLLLTIALAGAALPERGERRALTRSFFGVLRVVDQPRSGQRVLLHGTTLHGRQALDRMDRCEPTAYYAADGPLGALMRARGEAAQGPTAAIGLGTGALACYAQPGEPWRFYEINPDVVEIAPRWFTFLEQARTDVELVLADGRLGLAAEADAQRALILVDAFNSDAVPVHLLTREAIRLYLRKLRPGGWLALHLSNRVLELPTVVGDVLRAEGAAGRLSRSPEQTGAPDGATWAVIARREEDLATLPEALFGPLPTSDRHPWTDESSSLLDALQPLRLPRW